MTDDTLTPQELAEWEEVATSLLRNGHLLATGLRGLRRELQEALEHYRNGDEPDVGDLLLTSLTVEVLLGEHVLKRIECMSGPFGN